MAVLPGLWSRFSGAIIGLAIGRTAGTVFAPIFELLRQETWKDNAYAILSPATLAELVATGLTDFGQADLYARRHGLNTNQFRGLVEVTLNPPPLIQALEMRRRDSITEPQLRHVFEKLGIEPQYHDALVGLAGSLIPPSDLVRLAVREVFNPAQRDALDLDAEFPDAFADRMLKQGYSRSQSADWWAGHWELPSFEQLAQMRFRGAIETDAEFFAALKAIDIAPVWRPKFLNIARHIPTPSDFLRLVRRGVYTPAERTRFELDAEYPAAFTEKMALHGTTEQDARDIWAGGWRLPSARQLYQMLWRHEIEPADLDVGLRALDYPRFWRTRLANIARPVPPRVAINAMLRAGVIGAAEGHERFMQLGYTSDDADKLVEISLPGAAGADESSWVGRAKGRLFTVTRTEFVDDAISSDDARGLLVAIGVAAGELDVVLSMWQAEKEVRRRELTPTQIKKAYTTGKFTHDDAHGRLVDLGYTDQDAETFLGL